MSTILITGASGFIGRALARSLSEHHRVVALSRKNPGLEGIQYVEGDFANPADLEALDSLGIDVAIHLAAVTGGCSERDGILVNVEGTRTLVQSLIGVGCRKFVLASSIAVIGLQHTSFRPQSLPVADDHPCLDRDGYGLSKYLMEEMSKYLTRQHTDVDVTNLRLSVVVPEEDVLAAAQNGQPYGEWALATITMMQREDAVQAFSLAAEAPHQPGVRIMNAAAPVATSTRPTVEVLREWYGDDCDLSAYEGKSHVFDSVFSVETIRKELGFVAEHTVKTLSRLQKS